MFLQTRSVQRIAFQLALISCVLWTSVSGAQGACPKAHTASPVAGTDLLDTLDSGAMRRFYHQYMSTPNSSVSAPLLSPTKALNVTTLGVLGSLFDFKKDETSKTVTAEINPMFEYSVRQQTKELLAKAAAVPSKELLQMLNEAVHVQDFTNTSVIVTAKLVSTQFLKGFSQALLHRYQKVGMNVSDFVYRTSGLESEDPLTGMTMMDEMVQILKERRGFSFHLVYDKAVWEKELQALSARLEAYQKSQTPEEQQKIIRLVNQSTEPFLPFTGVVATEDMYRTGKPVELKRYFKNDFEDPLGFVQIQPRNDFSIRHQLLFHVIEKMPVGTVMEVHAHSQVHKRAYLRLGFQLALKTENPLYPGVEVYLLRGVREDLLQKIKRIIDTSAKGV